MTITIPTVKHFTKEQNEVIDQQMEEHGLKEPMGWTQGILFDAALLGLVYRTPKGDDLRADIYTENGQPAKAGAMLKRILTRGYLILDAKPDADGNLKYVTTATGKQLAAIRRPEWAAGKLPEVEIPKEVGERRERAKKAAAEKAEKAKAEKATDGSAPAKAAGKGKAKKTANAPAPEPTEPAAPSEPVVPADAKIAQLPEDVIVPVAGMTEAELREVLGNMVKAQLVNIASTLEITGTKSAKNPLIVDKIVGATFAATVAA